MQSDGRETARCEVHGCKTGGCLGRWVDMAIDGIEDRASLEEVFVGIIGKPVAQLLVEGRVGDDVWAVILAHLCAFQMTHPTNAEVRLRGIHEGISSSVLYLEADHEHSLAAYLAEFADIIGKGSLELFEQLATAVAERSERALGARPLHMTLWRSHRPRGTTDSIRP